MPHFSDVQRYVAFLSGLAVGRDAATPEEIRSLFSRLGFLDVVTHHTPDNVAFETSPVGVIAPLAAQIARHLRRSLHNDAIWVFIRTAEELERIADGVPFDYGEGDRVFVVFTSGTIDEHARRHLTVRRNDFDEIALAGGEIYWIRRAGGESVKPPSLSELLNAHSTVRSIHTIRELAEKFATESGRSRR